jgi:hypothetical protein
VLDDGAVQQQRDPLAELGRVGLVVGDEQGGQPARALELQEESAQVLAPVGVDAGQRLVQQEQVGLHAQRPGQRDPLLLPA